MTMLNFNPIKSLLLIIAVALLLIPACTTQPEIQQVDEAAIAQAAAEAASQAVGKAVAALPTPEPLIVEITRQIEVTRLVVVTATPTPTPDATPTPQSYDITATEVLTVLIDAGLPIGEHLVYTAESDPNELLGRPGQYTSKANFRDTRLVVQNSAEVDIDDGGAVEVFESAQAAQAWAEYIKTIGESLPMLVNYVLVEENVVVRLSKRLLPEQAEEYRQVLTGLLDR